MDALRNGEQFCYDTFSVQYASSMPNWVEKSGFKKQGTTSDFDSFMAFVHQDEAIWHCIRSVWFLSLMISKQLHEIKI